jgi:two-component system, sensor histidine kinase and response regulator
LLGNAVKFTDQGTVQLRMECRETERGRFLLCFEVTDTGIGIAAEHQESIFESFQQVESGPARRFGGTGLGLTICRRLVKLMSGEIGVHSAPGKGSRFWFTVELPAAVGHHVIAPRPQHLLGRRALIVEPNAAGRDVLRRQLQALGMTVAAVANIPEGLAQLLAVVDSAPRFDLLVIARPAASDSAANQAACDLQQSPAARQAHMIWLNRLGDSPAGDGLTLTKPVRPHQLRELLHDLFRKYDAPSYARS